jgi:hypothetical protein
MQTTGKTTVSAGHAIDSQSIATNRDLKGCSNQMSNALDTGEIVQLYIERNGACENIATRFECSYGKIYNLLRARVVMRTSPGKGGVRRTQEYLNVAKIMRERITTGDWPPARKILSQDDLAKIFDVRQQTIREAIAHLRQHGYLRTLPGKGTYVRPPQDWQDNAAQLPRPQHDAS